MVGEQVAESDAYDHRHNDPLCLREAEEVKTARRCNCYRCDRHQGGRRGGTRYGDEDRSIGKRKCAHHSDISTGCPLLNHASVCAMRTNSSPITHRHMSTLTQRIASLLAS